MKIKFGLLSSIVLLQTSLNSSFAQTNTFPATGNVGIGTITPGEKLTVLSATNVIGFAHTNGTVKLGSLLNSSGAFFGTATNHPLFFRTNNNAAQITLLQSGRVGIGTITPAGKLEVVGEDAYIQKIRIGVGRATGTGLDSLNTAVGRYSLQKTDPHIHSERSFTYPYGTANTAVGYATLKNNTDGYDNTAIGTSAMEGNTTGGYNCAMGSNALNASNGTGNSAFGAYVINSIT